MQKAKVMQPGVLSLSTSSVTIIAQERGTEFSKVHCMFCNICKDKTTSALLQAHKRQSGMQGTFIVFQDKVKPGKNFTGTQLFDTGGAFYNVPGFLDNLKVSLTSSLLHSAIATCLNHAKDFQISCQLVLSPRCRRTPDQLSAC